MLKRPGHVPNSSAVIQLEDRNLCFCFHLSRVERLNVHTPPHTWDDSPTYADSALRIVARLYSCSRFYSLLKKKEKKGSEGSLRDIKSRSVSNINESWVLMSLLPLSDARFAIQVDK